MATFTYANFPNNEIIIFLFLTFGFMHEFSGQSAIDEQSGNGKVRNNNVRMFERILNAWCLVHCDQNKLIQFIRMTKEIYCLQFQSIAGGWQCDLFVLAILCADFVCISMEETGCLIHFNSTSAN